MSLILRRDKGEDLTMDELDDNLEYLEGLGLSATTITELSSLQISNLHKTPVEIIPALGVDKYFDIKSIVLEFHPVTSAYTGSEVLRLVLDGEPMTKIEIGFYSDLVKCSVSIKEFGVFSGYVQRYQPNTPLKLTTSSPGLTGGDSTIKVIAEYKIREF